MHDLTSASSHAIHDLWMRAIINLNSFTVICEFSTVITLHIHYTHITFNQRVVGEVNIDTGTILPIDLLEIESNLCRNADYIVKHEKDKYFAFLISFE